MGLGLTKVYSAKHFFRLSSTGILALPVGIFAYRLDVMKACDACTDMGQLQHSVPFP